MSNYMSTVVYVNSRKRITSDFLNSDTHFKYFIPELEDSRYKFTKIALLSISIPKTYYLVTTSNKFFLIEGSDVIPISLPVGNYDILSFASTASSLMSYNSKNNIVYHIVSNALNILSGPVTGKYFYSYEGPSSMLIGIQLGATLFEQFGFDQDSEGVKVEIVKNHNGEAKHESFHTPFLVGADGARGMESTSSNAILRVLTTLRVRFYQKATRP